MQPKKINCLIVCSLIFILFPVACQKPTQSPLESISTNPPVASFVEPLPVITEMSLPQEIDYNDKKTWDLSDIEIGEIDPNRKLIAFTFDDAPKAHTEELLAVFAQFNEQNPDCVASASFFCNGVLINERSLPTLHTVVALGSELCNHSYSHTDLTKLSESELQSEIENLDALLRRVDGKFTHLFRAPYGKLDERVKRIVSAPIIDWTIDTLDWTKKSEDEIFNAVFSGKFSGAIVLMHDGYLNTVYAVKRLLPALKAENYQVVSLSKMAKAHDRALQCGNVYIRIRK